jgi:RimJ/RimL family protein N-acetyltransferase
MTDATQSVGPSIDWQPVAPPARTPIAGAYVTLEPIDPVGHAESLYAVKGDDPALWTYMPAGPFSDFATFQSWLEDCKKPDDPLCFALVDKTDGKAKGMASFMRITPDHGVIETGAIWFGPEIQRTRIATEAIYLQARHAFEELGYRRFEWKCDHFNAPSRRAAARFGFTYEGIFRQHVVYKGRSRDTAWFAMMDHEWPEIRAAFDAWLAPENFDGDGNQKTPLQARRDPA